MHRLRVIIRALTPARLKRNLERPTALTGPDPHQAPAEAVIPPGVRQADPGFRRPGETAAEGRQAVAELQLQPPARQLVIALAVASPSSVVRDKSASAPPARNPDDTPGLG